MCALMAAGGITAGLLHPAISSLEPPPVYCTPIPWALGGVILGLIAHILLPRR
jgi:hypothetical protein